MNKSNLQKLFKSQLIDLLLTKVIHITSTMTKNNLKKKKRGTLLGSHV